MYVENFKNGDEFTLRKITIPEGTSESIILNTTMQQMQEGYYPLPKNSEDKNTLMFSNDIKNVLFPTEYTDEQILEYLEKYFKINYTVALTDLYNMDYIHIIIVR